MNDRRNRLYDGGFLLPEAKAECKVDLPQTVKIHIRNETLLLRSSNP